MYAFLHLTIATAFRSIARNRLRAALTMLGIIIGVAAVIAMVSIGQGARALVQAQIATIGTNVIIVLPGATTVGGVRAGQGAAVTLTVADALDMKKKVPILLDTGWAKRDVLQIVSGNKNWNGPVNGISPSYLLIRDWSFAGGGSFTQADMDQAARVALLGETVVENLFEPGEDPMGATIRIKNVPFTVVGVLAPKGQSTQGSDQDDIVFIPFTTAERKVVGTSFLGSVGALFASTVRPEDLPEAVERIREVLRGRHRLQLDRHPAFLLRRRVGKRGLRHLSDAEHGLGRDTLVEERAVTPLHRVEVQARLIIAHPGPVRAAIAHEIGPRVGFRFGLHQPVLGCHARRSG